MYTILLWGMGTIYNKFFNLIKFEEIKKNITVGGIISKETYITSMDGYKVLDKEYILELKWDYIVVMAAGENYNEILTEISEKNIDRDKVIDGIVFAVPGFDFISYIKLKESRISIISDCCWGGFVYHRLKLKFTSPFINSYIETQDYISLLENLDDHLEKPLELNHELTMHTNISVGRLGNVSIYFPHDESFKAAKIKWEERKARLNFNNLLIMIRIDDNIELAERFDALPYRKKIGFSSIPMKYDSICYMPEYSEEQKCKFRPIWYKLYQNSYFYEYIISDEVMDTMDYFSLMEGNIQGIRRKNINKISF